jgi:hypothetical protein
MMNEQDVKKMFTSNLEIANYYDSIKNIKKTMEYSFMVVQEDPTDVICLTKIVYWASFYKNYDDILKLIAMVRNNTIQSNKLKEIFYRENKLPIKDLLVGYYIDAVKEKINQIKQINCIAGPGAQVQDTKSTDEYLKTFYQTMMHFDYRVLYDEYLMESDLIKQYRIKLQDLELKLELGLDLDLEVKNQELSG